MGDPDDRSSTPPPRRTPRPLWVHVLVDATVAFAALVLVLWFVGVAPWVTAIVAAIGGAAAAPFTLRAQQRATGSEAPGSEPPGADGSAKPGS